MKKMLLILLTFLVAGYILHAQLPAATHSDQPQADTAKHECPIIIIIQFKVIQIILSPTNEQRPESFIADKAKQQAPLKTSSYFPVFKYLWLP
jgi:hypothetical protein